MPEGREPREAELRQAIGEIVAAGRTTLAELTDALRRRGLLDHVGPHPDDELDAVLQLISRNDEIWISRDDVVVLIEHLVRDVVMTHRVTEDDLARGMLDAAPDLELLDNGWLASMELDGAPLERVFTDELEAAGSDGSFVGRPGWLDQFRAGDVLALRRSGGQVTIERVGDVGAGEAEVAALRRAFDASGRPADVGELIEAVVLDALVSTPGLFREPVRPMGELLHDAGLSCQGEWTGLADADWAPGYVAAAESDMSIIHDRYELDECCDESLYAALDMWNEFVVGTRGGAPREWSWSNAADELAHGEVAAAFTDFVLRDYPSSSNPFLASFAHDMAESTRKQDRAVAAYLEARNLEREGSAAEAEAALETAVQLDPQLAPALDDLAWYAADRSQVDKAVNLLRRAGAPPDDAHLQMLEAMRPKRNAVGRNERCPCGSGRKYKDCCQRLLLLPIEDRAKWLQHKLWTYVLRPRHQAAAMVLAMRMSPDDDDLAHDLLETGLPMDLAAFEGGLADQFLRERGHLLPTDERDLLETWLQQPRELWEVVERVTDSTVVARRVATGELVTLTSVEERAPGDLVLARVAPLGGSQRAVGTMIQVPGNARSSAEALLASQPDEWAIANWVATTLVGGEEGEPYESVS